LPALLLLNPENPAKPEAGADSFDAGEVAFTPKEKPGAVEALAAAPGRGVEQHAHASLSLVLNTMQELQIELTMLQVLKALWFKRIEC
jgi:hypothetical protein